MRKSSVSLLVGLLFITVFGCAKSIETVVEQNDPKVVKLGIVLNNHREGVCSGVIIDKDGDILTCAHCFEHKGIIKLFIKTFDGQVLQGLPIRTDEKKDLALITIMSMRDDWPYIKLGKEPRKGQQVVLFGSPLAVQGTISVGYIENFLKGFDGVPHRIVIQSAATNPGNSGGPLVDLSGRLIGIGEGTIMMNPFQVATGMGFAINVNEIRAFLEGN